MRARIHAHFRTDGAVPRAILTFDEFTKGGVQLRHVVRARDFDTKASFQASCLAAAKKAGVSERLAKALADDAWSVCHPKKPITKKVTKKKAATRKKTAAAKN